MTQEKSFFTVDTQLDPESNYYSNIIHHVDNCDYHDGGSFIPLAKTYSEVGDRSLFM